MKKIGQNVKLMTIAAGPWRSVSLACLMALVPAAAQGAAEYYTEPQLYSMRPNPNAETEMGPIGATGIEARTPERSFKNNSDWGDGEFLLMRTTFDVKDLDNDYYRLNILADQGYHIYLNGHRIHSFPWLEHFPKYVQIMLGEQQISHLKKGANTLAVYCNVRYEQDAQTMKYHPVGQMDIFLEGLKKNEIGLTK